MRIGVAFPTVEIGHDLGAVRSFVQAAEDLGYDHIRILDHVLGADPQYPPEVDYFAYTPVVLRSSKQKRAMLPKTTLF